MSNPTPLMRKSHEATRLSCKVWTVGHIQNSPHHCTAGTYQRDVMLTLFISGRGEYRLKDERLSITAGMIGLVFPSLNTGLLVADAGDPYDHYYCRFSGQEAFEAASRISVAFKRSPFFLWPDWQILVEPFAELEKLQLNYTYSREIPSEAEARLKLILAMMESRLQQKDPGLNREALLQYMEDHVAEPIELEALAAHFKVSKAHLCRQAKRLLGCTIVQHWTHLKLQWSHFLLHKGISITQVAHHCGYEDALYFSKVFKKQWGVSPRAWLNLNSAVEKNEPQIYTDFHGYN